MDERFVGYIMKIIQKECIDQGRFCENHLSNKNMLDRTNI